MAKVLVIDDDPELLQMVGLMLERGGHTPILENKPRKGLERIKAERPDLLILDVMMPSVSGHELCQQIRRTEETAYLPILILTARAQTVDRQAALASGADDYLSKPVVPKVLMEHVDRLLTADEVPDFNATGLIIAFFGMRGGDGRTTLATNLAAALRRTSGEEVCLLDMSPSGGQAAIHLRMQTRSTWADLPSVNQLDWASLKEHMLMHQSGLRLLAAPREPQLPIAPSSELTATVLTVLRQRARFTVIDLPSVFNPGVQAVLEQSNVVMHVVSPEVVSVQVARNTSQALTQSELILKQKVYVLNQTVPEAQLEPEAVEKGLSARPAFKVGFDRNQSRALAQGLPLSLTSSQSPLSAVTRQLAEVMWQRANEREDGGDSDTLRERMSRSS